MGPMEENREDDAGLISGGSIHPDAATMDTMLPPIKDMATHLWLLHL